MGADRGWIEALARHAAAGEPCVIVTVAAVRGHAPRAAGTKMLVTASSTDGTIGGGDLEARAIARSREILDGPAGDRAAGPELTTVRLTPAGGEHGVQCCGGEVTLMLEPVDVREPTVAIFGAGHVGKALVRVLATLPIRLVLVDSRESQLEGASTSADAEATLDKIHAPIPESAIEDLPAGTHVVILTHDHAEDIAILDTALRRSDLGYLGLIGSRAKWSHFQGRLRAQGHDDDVLARVTTPIGLPGVPGKSPGAIAIATAAQLVGIMDADAPDVSSDPRATPDRQPER